MPMNEQSEGIAKMNMDWKHVKSQIEGDVQCGTITREEANAKYKAIREWLAKPHGDDCPDWECIGR